MIANEEVRITTAQKIRKIMDCEAVVVKGNGDRMEEGNGVIMS